MKQICYVVIGILITFNLDAQIIKTNQTFKSIVQQRSIYLNGGARATFGGKSRNTIQIQLPEGTKSWYYSFTTSPGESGTANLNLLAQLSSTFLNLGGITKSALSNIEVPTGSNSVDIYILDQNNSDLFLNKVDNDGGTFSYYREGYVLNTKEAIVDVNNINEGIIYLGLKNPSNLDGINIQIEVVALVEHVEEETETESQALTYGNLGWKAFEREDYNKCIELSKKALALDNSLGFAHFNLAISFLITGKTTEAINAYTKAIAVTKKTAKPKESFDGAILDLKKYMDKFPSKNDAQDILDLLVEETKNY